MTSRPPGARKISHNLRILRARKPFQCFPEKLTATRGGKPAEPYTGKGATTVVFSEPGNYVLHVTVNDLSGPGGGATGCCWTTSLIKVAVKSSTTELR